MWNIRNITQEIPLTLCVHRKGWTFPHLRPPPSKPKDAGPTISSKSHEYTNRKLGIGPQETCFPRDHDAFPNPLVYLSPLLGHLMRWRRPQFLGTSHEKIPVT